MVIKLTDHVTHCHTNNEGNKIFNIIKPLIDKGNRVEISFNGIDSITSSFVNSAFIELLQYFKFGYIKSKLNFIS
ncbi:STAS-like domain-containing protein, partial [Desulfococcaceae bacterium HSG8]|nr:STAS-like domain-containing protein [Desulfococcaceae bacterium HSG8]